MTTTTVSTVSRARADGHSTQRPDLDLVLGEYANKLTRHKARQLVGQFGFTRSDRDDLEQELRTHLFQQAARFDPERGSASTFISRVLSRKVVSIIRHRCADQRHCYRVACSLNDLVRDEDDAWLERGQTLPPDADRRRTAATDVPSDLSIDLRQAVDALEPRLQRLWHVLLSNTVTDAARELGVSRLVVYARVQELREHFAAHGLQTYVFANADSSDRAGVCDQ